VSAITPDLNGFFDEFESALQRGSLPIRTFNDPAIHALELDRIFTRAWVFVGHESEIPAHGDYVQRPIGRDPFVLVRGDDGRIRVLFDACRHRGAMVCRAERGNAALFRCPYHGWTYKNTGELVGMPLMRAAYGSGIDKSELGLFAAPHVESLHGLVFASLDPDAPPLAEYLGDMAFYLDMIWGQCKDGWEVIGDPQRYTLTADWKTGAENFAGDDYHTFYLHRSTIETGIMGGVRYGDISENLEGFHIQAGNGHNLIRFMIPPNVEGPHFFGYPDEVIELFDPGLQGQRLYDAADQTVGFVGTVFPNFSFLGFPLYHVPSAGPVATVVLHLWEPIGPGEIVVWTWVMCPRGVSEDYRRDTYRTTMGTFSAGGTFEADDTDPWMSIARSAGTTYGRKIGMKADYRMGMDGSGASKRMLDYPDPGIAFYNVLEEGAARGFHRRWLQFMRAESFPPQMTAEEQNAGAGLPARNRDG
jgi:phenylpropionate dioxygenase-like ring-hydroxylating dioxygenase large terminal subunit